LRTKSADLIGRLCLEELTIVLSDAVLPQIMRKSERTRVEDQVAGLVIPTGYSCNLEAFSI
jgi:aerobic C4-dicarboxylate transport protein